MLRKEPNMQHKNNATNRLRNLRGKTMGRSTPRPSTQPKQYHELKQYKKSNYGIELNIIKSLETIIKQLLKQHPWR